MHRRWPERLAHGPHTDFNTNVVVEPLCPRMGVLKGMICSMARRSTITGWSVGGILLLGGLGGCASSNSESDSRSLTSGETAASTNNDPPTQSTSDDGEGGSENDLIEQVRAHAEAFVERPGSVYDSFIAACKENLTREEFAGQMLLGTGMFEQMYGVAITDLSVGEVSVRNFAPTSAEVSLELLTPEGDPIADNEYTVWVFEDGAWKSTDCDDGISADGSAASGDTVTGELRPAGEVSEEQKRSAATVGAVGGQAVEIAGVYLAVASISLESVVDGDGTDNAYRVAVQVRAENRTTDDLTAPELMVRCADGKDGSWYADSTYPMYGDLPSGTFAEGVLMLGVPTGCQDPVVFVEALIGSDSALWAFPPGVSP